MKKWIISGVLSLMMFAYTHAQENLDKLPSNALHIIEMSYSTHEIDKVNAEPNSGEDSYQVKFKNGTKIDFDESGKPTQIKGDEKVPYELLPKKMKYFLENRYKNDYVTNWKMDDDSHQIEMKSGAELIFDLDGNFLKNKNL
ncbi:PepSY-like domain-containing protein [Mesonia aestuariivivens]|uniref:PepSY-like domain-containing protein n=1 Tax=Mesonia aestuariivivens TaxID=2796128 RepID=A0ABS6W0U7_9FLAO|nr:PepSY-like domain-containing protein [Mesonia aestuariivivens]MBW2961467.1 PepSY-like domain-containing protein [Mesonia aestuariivivens]